MKGSSSHAAFKENESFTSAQKTLFLKILFKLKTSGRISEKNDMKRERGLGFKKPARNDSIFEREFKRLKAFFSLYLIVV
jgi:hypothetical protein